MFKHLFQLCILSKSEFIPNMMLCHLKQQNNGGFFESFNGCYLKLGYFLDSKQLGIRQNAFSFYPDAHVLTI